MKEKTLFGDVLTTVTKYFLILVIVILVGIFFSGVRRVESGNVALVLRFGKLVGATPEEQVREPGLLFSFPYMIDEVVVVPTGNVIEQTVTTHFTEDGTKTAEGGYVVTGDQNIAVISASVKYVVSDPVAYALNVRNLPDILNAAVSSAMINEAARVGVDRLLTDGKDAYADAVLTRTAEKLSRIGAGITLTTLELTKVGMPGEVRTTYDRVNSATVEAATILERAAQYRENLLPMARAEANATVNAANSKRSRSVAAANADLAEFWGVLDEYNTDADVVRTRLYAAKTETLMNRIGKIRVVQTGETKIFLNP